jgi:hypothetical protein
MEQALPPLPDNTWRQEEGNIMQRKALWLAAICLVFIVCDSMQQKPVAPAKQAIMTTTGNGDIVIYEPEKDQAVFITKSGVVFKTVSISKPTIFETYKHFERQIHNTQDSVFVDAEWIGDKVYWSARTNGLRTRNTNNLKLMTYYENPVVFLCGNNCNWVPVFDAFSGKTTHYQAVGVVPDISIDAWSRAQSLSFSAVPK